MGNIHMTQEFDPRKSYLSVKAHENMIAYAGFRIQDGKDVRDQEGVIKISSFQRPYGGGYFTLTFIVDTKDDKDIRDNLNQLFNKLTEDALKPFLGKDMKKIVKVSLDSLEKIPEWYIQEVSVHFSKMDERQNVMIEERLIPALASTLSFSFDSVEWWPADKPVREPEEASFMEQISLKGLFRKWFKGD
jgi:hypothetical protein